MIASSFSRPDRVRRCSARGFTLAELAIALVILALLLAGALIPLSTQIEVRAIADTQRTMEQMREAVIGFAVVNGRLPCPARGQTPTGGTDTTTWPGNSISAGAEQYDSTNLRCFTAVGVVPWATLGVAEVDAWGRRFSYRVAPAFADAIDLDASAAFLGTWQSRLNAVPVTFTSQTAPSITSPADQAPTCPSTAGALVPMASSSSFAICSLGDIAVFTRNEASHAAVAIGSALPAVIISHGRNGFGAYQTGGTRITGSGDATGEGVPDQNADESANANGGAPNAVYVGPSGTSNCTIAGVACTGIYYSQWAFFSRTPVASSSGCSDPNAGSPLCEFDDIVFMIPSQNLMSRMIAAGKLP